MAEGASVGMERDLDMAECASVGMEGPGCGSSASEVSMDKGQQHPLTPTKNLKISIKDCNALSTAATTTKMEKERKVNWCKNCVVLSAAATTKKQPVVVLIHSTVQNGAPHCGSGELGRGRGGVGQWWDIWLVS